MANLAFQRRTTKRILQAAPKLKFVAFYHRSEDRLNACMKDYGDRSFVYVFSSCYLDEEYFLYVGKSKKQYARVLAHSKKYEHDHIYLFECDPEWLAESEKAVINDLRPIFYRNNNPDATRIRHLLEINYDAFHSRKVIEQYLHRCSNYKRTGLFGFSLPVVRYSAIEDKARQIGCSCSELVFRILEQAILNEGKINLDNVKDVKTNLITTKKFAERYDVSQQQVKQYLRQPERMPGTVKVGKTWLIPYDLEYPEAIGTKRRILPGIEDEL